MTTDTHRNCQIKRVTRETDITIDLDIDGRGQAKIDTHVPFFDHMLTLFTVHGFFNLEIKATGDVEVDDHHTVEDVGICLGQAFKKALTDFGAINRYGDSAVPMDETLARVSLDLSNRPFLHYDVVDLEAKTGTFDTCLVKEFLRAFTFHGGMTLHVEVRYGENTHHILEAIFKALGRALDRATSVNTRSRGPLSSKGTL